MTEPFDKLKKSLHEVMALTEEKIDKRLKAAREFSQQVQQDELQVQEDLEILKAERASIEDAKVEVQRQLEEIALVRAELEAKKNGGLFACCMSKPKTQASDITVHVEGEPEMQTH
mmetsp:Transcript_140173/g.349348  ORF Transcript_140173/g.349348 Transcript_140173/m.349348 type:complete len:116 (+) Transcript_140173:102-449(+)|eukprot:CAMPEP_0115213354 /NCGR_PEP_ID=MMETSP0270-20121206/23750_1 /TAXON_ID=71861 /ORGANISM="Scrippsiella trochoidea, Strain CCMP3099" /LENGTH=115 /DNA_ID=CAMNT_0002627099 /DNA_START=108 /DNA_END=455 /DNA_ORIENTATION=+